MNVTSLNDIHEMAYAWHPPSDQLDRDHIDTDRMLGVARSHLHGRSPQMIALSNIHSILDGSATTPG